jgi:DnaJ-class molecular chaperone
MKGVILMLNCWREADAVSVQIASLEGQMKAEIDKIVSEYKPQIDALTKAKNLLYGLNEVCSICDGTGANPATKENCGLCCGTGVVK